MMSLGGIRLGGLADDVKGEGGIAKVNHGVHSVLGVVLEVVLDLSPITIKTNGISIFSSRYEICHKKKGFFICFFTCLKGYDGWRSIGPYPEG